MPDTRPRATDAQLRQALNAVRLRHDVPGLAGAVFDREQRRVFGVGELTPGGNPVTPDSRFRAGQLSLLFTGITAASLVSDGSIPEQGELRRLAPEVDVHNPWSGERAISVSDLLSHRAGLGATRFRDVYATTAEQPLLAGINSAFRALRVEHRPGEFERYSLVGHAIAAYIIEKAAGMPYETVLQRMLFEPLEASASLGRPSGALSVDSDGHAGWPPRAAPSTPLNFPSAGDIWISAQDMARVGQLLVSRGRYGDRELVRPAALEWMESLRDDAVPLIPGARRGVEAEEFNGMPFFTQTGALPGFLARFAYSPALGRGYVVMLNHGDAHVALAEAEALLRGQLFAAGVSLPDVPASSAELPDIETLTGWYRDVTPELAPRAFYQSLLGFAHARSCNNAVCFSRPGKQQRLEHFDAGRLRSEGQWQADWAVRMTESGTWLESRDSRWLQAPGWQVMLSLGVVALLSAGILLALGLLPFWGWAIVSRRLSTYHQLVPRLLPLAAVLAVPAFHIALFTADYPALGEVSAPSVAILVLSLLAPLLALLALPAAIAGFFWRLPRRATITCVALALTAVGAVVLMAIHDLVAFQTWNY